MYGQQNIKISVVFRRPLNGEVHTGVYNLCVHVLTCVRYQADANTSTLSFVSVCVCVCVCVCV